jgi:WD40 repeat protein
MLSLQGAVTAVAWTPDGCYCASAGEDDAVRLYAVRGTGVSALAEVTLLL